MNNLDSAIRAAAYLSDKAYKENDTMSAQFSQELKNGNIELRPSAIIHRAQYTGREMVTSATRELNGVTDFQGKEIDSVKTIVVNGVKIGYADATGTSPALVKYVHDRENLPAAFVNGSLEVKQAGKPVFKMPVSRLLAQVSGDSANADAKALGGFFLIRGGIETEINFILPDGATNFGETNNAFIGVEFEGFVTARRSLG